MVPKLLAMKRLLIAVSLVLAGCAAAVPVQGPVESPNTPLVVLENAGQRAVAVEDHYDDVNRLTDEMFQDR